MNFKVKIVLDIFMGAVIPIFILNNLSEQLGTAQTYVLAALVPVAWILVDLCFISRKFNFITSYTGSFTIIRGLLAFWFVDGVLFAFKDSVGFIFTVAVFGISIIICKPIMYYFLMQGMNPDSPRRKRALKALLAESKVYGALIKSTKLVLAINLFLGLANFFLNLKIVMADFGTSTFNQQVAQVNAITQIGFIIPELIGVGIAALMIRRAILYYLPEEEDDEDDDSDFWDLLQRREAQKITGL